WVSMRPWPRISESMLARIVFDQIVLPLWLWRRRAALFCSGNFAPILKAVPTVVLIRNAIYFERDFLQREWWGRRALLHLQGLLIRVGAMGCLRAHYPSQYMRRIFEKGDGHEAERGRVNYYGIGQAFADESARAPKPPSTPHYRFLFVMNYTLQ